jgi:hypothetical protein
MARSDFVLVSFNQQFNENNTVATETFMVEGNPTGSGYLLIQARDVEQGSHRISINGEALPSFDIPTAGNNQWVTWMDRIPAGHLEPGENRITIRRVGAEDFRVNDVAVHWKETG